MCRLGRASPGRLRRKAPAWFTLIASGPLRVERIAQRGAHLAVEGRELVVERGHARAVEVGDAQVILQALTDRRARRRSPGCRARRRRCAPPTPESSSSCGELMRAAHTAAPRGVRCATDARRPRRYSTPVARVPANVTRVASACWLDLEVAACAHGPAGRRSRRDAHAVLDRDLPQACALALLRR